MNQRNYQLLTDGQLAHVIRTAQVIVDRCQQTLEDRGYQVVTITDETIIRKDL